MDKQNNMSILRLLWQASKPYKAKRNLAIIVAIATTSVSMFVAPLVIASLLDMIQNGQLDNMNSLWWLIGVYAASQLWSEIIGVRLVLYLIWIFETSMQRDIYVRVFKKLTEETMFFHSNKFSGSLVSQSNKLASTVERFWDSIIWAVLPVGISLIGSIAILSVLLWQYAIFLGVFSVLFIILVYFGSRPMAKLNEQEAAASNKLSGRLADAISNILAVKTSAAEAKEISEFTSSTNHWREASLNTMRGFLKVSTAYSSVTTLIKVGAVAFAVFAAKNDMVSIAAIYLIVTYTASVARELWSMNGIMRNYNRIMGDAREMTDILNSETTLLDTSAKELSVNRGQININNLTYTHDEGSGATLFKDFSLSIKPGEKVGLIGTSGSGKTTLTKLLLRLSDIDSGEILVDDQNIADVTQRSLRDAIAYVPQEPLLFHRSIRENIAYAKPNATETEIKKAAKQAHAYEFIEQLAKGFDTLVGERGVKLSGGQRQRIAIARAILKDAPILILDEATSALDSESEKLIQASLDDLMKNRTSIVIAHRLSTISKLDRIVVLDKGKIVEDGTHSELLKKKGTYAKLWSHQSGGFIEE